MVDIKRILLPTDYSQLSAHAASYVKFLAAGLRADVHVLHVVSLSSAASVALAAGDVGASFLFPDTQSSVESQRPQINHFAEEFMDQSELHVFTDVRVGLPSDAIAQYAREKQIDLIVIGSHARGMVNRIFFGSTSKAVLESAPCPVLMVPVVTMPDAAAGPTAECSSEG